MANAPAVVKFWDEFKRRCPHRDDLELSGMTYNKGGYHSTRDWLLRNKPGDYSIQRPADKRGPSDVGSAIDITFHTAQRGNYSNIKLYMDRLRDALVRDDKRLYAADGVTNIFREVIGTLDGKNPANVSFYKEAVLSNSDRSHMWHMHFSFTRAWLNDFSVYEPLLDILFPGTNPAPAPEPERDWFDMATKADLEAAVDKVLLARRDEIADAVWAKHLTPGASTRVIGGYPDDFDAPAASFEMAPDAKLNEVRRTLAGVVKAQQELANAMGPMVRAAVQEALKDAVVDVDINVHGAESEAA
jgi:hypothetical protein